MQMMPVLYMYGVSQQNNQQISSLSYRSKHLLHWSKAASDDGRQNANCLGTQLTRVIQHISSKDHIRLKIMRPLPLHLQDLYSLQCMHTFDPALGRRCWLDCDSLARQRI